MANEDQIVRRLRAIIVVMFGLGIAAAVAGNGNMRFFVCCFFIPGGWAYVHPRWPAIVIWIMFSSSIGMLGFLLALGRISKLLASPSLYFMLGAAVLLFLVLPIVRRMHEAPPMMRRSSRIPEAKIHRRDR